jgi:hypothetical protein
MARIKRLSPAEIELMCDCKRKHIITGSKDKIEVETFRAEAEEKKGLIDSLFGDDDEEAE